MNTDCQHCKHARLWTEAEKFAYIERIYKSVGRVPIAMNHYICDKIKAGDTWYDAEEDKEYAYGGYSLDGENYDEVFHCFEGRDKE